MLQTRTQVLPECYSFAQYFPPALKRWYHTIPNDIALFVFLYFRALLSLLLDLLLKDLDVVCQSGDGGLKSVDILGKQLVGCLVLLQDVAVDGTAGQDAAKQEAEKTSSEGAHWLPRRQGCRLVQTASRSVEAARRKRTGEYS